jgi:hypothetical protein|mmetsp:Transcript_89960/g.142153  ORF Transcript_89960/g.142153 Transcript_89960/m.142153 type:complete len:526 (+) Transcript_89960:55-1632(+)
MTVLANNDTSSKMIGSPSKGRSPIKMKKSPPKVSKSSSPTKVSKNSSPTKTNGSSETLHSSLKRKLPVLDKSGSVGQKRFRGIQGVKKSKPFMPMMHPKRPVGEPWPLEELNAFDTPQDPVLREVLKARGWRQSLNPCPGKSGPQAGVCTFFAKQCNPNLYSRTTSRPNYALWFLGRAPTRDSSASNNIREKEEFVKVVVDHGANLPGKSGNYRLAKFPGTETLLSKFHVVDAFKNKPWFPNAFTLPRDRAAAMHEIRSKLDSRNNSWVTTSPSSEDAGMNVWHGADPKLARMVRESDWYPRSIVHQQIADPLLVGGYKFHMRINLVITNLSPLEAFVHENGRCVFATKPVTSASRSYGEWFDADAHVVKNGLTTKPEALDNHLKGLNGQQIRMRQLVAYLAENYPSFKKQALWHQILDIAAEVAGYLSQGVLKHSRVVRDRHFEVLGMDLVLDRNLKVWMSGLDTDSNWGYPEKDVPVSYNPDFTEEVKAFGDIYHDLFALLGVDAGHKQPQGSLSHWLKIESQ